MAKNADKLMYLVMTKVKSRQCDLLCGDNEV